MKYTKKILALLLALSICISFASCAKKEKTETETEKETVETKNPQQEMEQEQEQQEKNIISVFKDDEKLISLGDSREQIEKAMGEAESSGNYSLKYDGITVYLDKMVNMITITSKGYTGYGKAQIGMTIDELKENVGKNEYYEEEQADIGFYRMTFAADENGNLIENPDYNTTLSAPYLYIITSNNYGTKSEITHIQIKDNRNQE